MRWLYVFAVIFLMIFGLVSLIHILVRTFIDGCSRKYDVYVMDDEYIDEFIENAKKSAFIGKIYIIKPGGGFDAPCRVGDGRQLCDDDGKR